VVPSNTIMQIFVKSFLDGKIIALDVIPSSTVANVSSTAAALILPVDPLRLIYGGKELENAKSLFDYNIRKESILQLGKPQ
ncbi:ubiquitin, partial [Lactarius psammicola]